MAGHGKREWTMEAWSVPAFLGTLLIPGRLQASYFDSPSDQALLAGGGHLGALFFLFLMIFLSLLPRYLLWCSASPVYMARVLHTTRRAQGLQV